MKDEIKEELEKIERMNPYERLSYIRLLTEFYMTIDDNKPNAFYEQLMLVTRGYE